MYKTPILFLIFNRPEITQKVFEEIKRQKPKYLFVAADGPRSYIKGDIEKCEATRNLVLNGIDWECKVETLFRSENLGCGIAVSSAITWFFENVEQGVILEDDCLPHYSFFSYCETLLEKYKENDNVFVISGDNFQEGIQRGHSSYYFSNYCHIWGWASWRRAWKFYDFNLNQFDYFKESQLINKIDSRKSFKNYWFSIFDKVISKEIDTWDYQLIFTIWINRGVSIVPNVNLVSNIGFGVDATHTIGESQFANIETQDIGVILHPKIIKVHEQADIYTSDRVFNISANKNYTFIWLFKNVYKFLFKKFKL
jgi:hypothetical protein